ncbi:MAG: hypothetical protein GW913_04265 [Myxococcales bacterium]|nr:hypothetical protein [Myxococcales bacterium]
MKAFALSSRRLLPLSGLLALGIVAVGCGGPAEYGLVGSARAAGTDGTVQVEEIEGGNQMVTLTLDHLPPPARLADGMTTYVVWLTQRGQQPTKAGALDYDEDARTGHMIATTPLTRFTLRITAEENRDVAAPSDLVVAERVVGGEN